MFTLAVIASVILFFGLFGGLLCIGLLKIHFKSRLIQRSVNVVIFVVSLCSLLLALSIALSTVAIAIRLLGAAGMGLALYALLRLFKGKR